MKRIAVALVLLPIGITAIMAGGWWFTGIMLVLLCLAAFEFVQLFKIGGLQANVYLVVGGTAALIVSRAVSGFENDAWLLPLLVFLSMASHLWAYEGGRDKAATDLSVTLMGIFYIGLLGSYFMPMRNLPEGEWWILVVLPAVWLADSGAYFYGSKYGKSKMAPRLSPNKSWQGYFAGIVAAAVFTPLLVKWYYQMGLNPDGAITLTRAVVIGIMMGIIPTLGDLGESMIKRQVGQKDSGTILPGHGGLFDRVDSWLWAGAIGFFTIFWFF